MHGALELIADLRRLGSKVPEEMAPFKPCKDWMKKQPSGSNKSSLDLASRSPNSMTIKELRLLPPLAFGRFGSASVPQGNYTLEEDENDPLGFRKIVPVDTLIVDPDGTVSVRPADRSERDITDLNKIFRDGDQIRPVAPFFELFAATGDDEKPLERITLSRLKKENIDLGAVEWRVRVENRKVFRRTGDRGTS